MSGIVGIYNFNKQPVDPQLVETMALTMKHRGPDGQKIWCDKNVGIAHLSLKTTPEALHETLPYYDGGARIVITADARLDNRQDLLDKLGNDAESPHRILPDSILILEAYKKWGIDCPRHLLGDYAVVIWDESEERLFVFRDHFGVKPLFYHKSRKNLAFASEIKALLASPDVPEMVNEERIADFLAGQDDVRSTFYKDIQSLAPAHFLVSVRGEVIEKKYWQLEPGPILKLKNAEEYTEAFKEIFQESVRCRLRRIGPIGSHLSGGLDSSSIAATARDMMVKEGPEQLHTFSFYFEDLPKCDERKFIKPIVEQGNVIPHFIQADQYPSRQEYDVMQTVFENAEAAFNANPVWLLNRQASKLGVRILLDGFDGDSTVSHGTGLLVELSRSLRWMKLLREAEGFARNFQIPFGKLTYYYLRKYSVLSYPLTLPIRIKQRIKKNRNHSQLSKGKNFDTLLSDDFSRKVNAEKRFQTLSNPLPLAEHGEQAWQFRKLTNPVMARVLNITDRCSAHFSIEKRFPFWDKRLIEFCLRLPAEQKLNKGFSRMIMRRAMETSLPEIVRWRGGKVDFLEHATGFALNLIEIYDLKSKNAFSRALRYLDEKKLESFFKNPEVGLTGENALGFYRILALMTWLEFNDEK